MERTWILDNGHGGTINGKYVTAPSKMYEHEGGVVIHEGVVNRLIVKEIVELFRNDCKTNYVVLVPEEDDISLGERVRRIDKMYSKDVTAILVSIHLNAGGGKNKEIFTSVGQTRSDDIAEVFIDSFEGSFPDESMRVDLSDGDRDKEANFYILRKSDCPAILTENGFMDNKKEAINLLTKEGQKEIALAHYKAMMEVEECLKI